MSAADLESRVEILCNIILKTDSENWDVKNKALLQMTELIISYDSQPPMVLQEAFSQNFFRLLKEPVKILISDLRSQQVRDVCIFLTELAKVSGEKMKLFLRDSFSFILEGIKVPNKVMSGYVDECITNLIKYTIFKSGIPVLANEIRDSKAKLVREKCLEYMMDILMSWEDLNDKEIDLIGDSIKIGLEDASVRAREIARDGFANFSHLCPKKAEKILVELPKALQQKLQQASHDDDGHTGSLESSLTSTGASDNGLSQMNSSNNERHLHHQTPLHHTTSQHAHALHISNTAADQIPPAPKPDTPASAVRPSSSKLSSITKPTISGHKAENPSTLRSSTTYIHKIEAMGPPMPRASSLTASHLPSKEEKAPITTASSSSAVAPPVASRRRSVVRNPFLDLSESFATTPNTSAPSSKASSPQKPSPTKSSSSPSNLSKSFSLDDTKATFMPPKAPIMSRPSSDSLASSVSSTSRNHFIESSASATKPIETMSLRGFKIGDRVIATATKDNKVPGTVRFVGTTKFAAGNWIGVQLDTAMGKNNGSVQGESYFTCENNFGLFLREENVSAAPIIAEVESTIKPVIKQIKSTGALRIKLSQMMGLLNQQLAIIEELDKEEQADSNSLIVQDLRQEIMEITKQELDSIHSFETAWNSFL